MSLRFLILDDHEMILNGMQNLLEQEYPDSIITAVQTSEEALNEFKSSLPDLFVADLCIPSKAGDIAETSTGILLLEDILASYPNLNILVQSTFVKSLVRIKMEIYNHNGGFVILDKSTSSKEALTKVDWALKGLLYIPQELRSGLEIKPEWLEILSLAFKEGLQDKAIAERMKVSVRTIRVYWTRIQDALEVYPEPHINMRIQTEKRARETGLID